MKLKGLSGRPLQGAIAAAALLALGYWIGSKGGGHPAGKSTFVPPPSLRRSLDSGKHEVPNFLLLDQNSEAHELYYYKKSSAIVIISYANDCAIVQKSAAALESLKASFAARGVEFFLLNTNPHDTREQVQAQAKSFGITIPILMDPSQVVTRLLKFDRTAEAIVVDTRDFSEAFRGGIEDRFQLGATKRKSKDYFLKNALEALLSEAKAHSPNAGGMGCMITFEDRPPVTYVSAIAGVFRSKCANCHNVNSKIKPVFDNYDTIKSWASMIRETVLTQRMPPTGLDPEFGNFENAETLSPHELADLYQWLEGGMPRGKGADPLVVNPPGKPERNYLTAPLFKADIGVDQIVPPEGFEEYKDYQLAGPMDRDTWISEVRCIPSIPQYIHHVVIQVVEKPLSTYVQAHEAGTTARPEGTFSFPMEIARLNRGSHHFFRKQVFAAGFKQPTRPSAELWAIFVPKGAYIIAQIHYNGSGKQETDRTRFEFFEYKNKKPPSILHTGWVFAKDFVIPPRAEKVEVFKTKKLKKSIRMISINPHMHIRGKALSLTAKYPDGHEEKIFSVPNYYYGWHVGEWFRFKTPKFFPAGTELTSQAVFDNSDKNPYNPDTDKEVKWGERVEDGEMPKVNYEYVEATK